MSTAQNPAKESVKERAPNLVDEGDTESGKLYSVKAEGVRYYLIEKNPTTLQLQSMETECDGGIPSSVVAGTRYEDLPNEVRLTLKVEGYRMVGKNSLLLEVM